MVIITQFKMHPRCYYHLPLLRRSSRLHLHVKVAIATWKRDLYSSNSLHCKPSTPNRKEQKENIYTVPNLLTVGRIALCPLIGWSILNSEYHQATALVVLAGFTDFVDGYLARRFNTHTVLGSILDPAADKILMATLTVSLTTNHLLPVPLSVIIIGRDVVLGIMALFYRYRSLPSPKTFRRYWDITIPSASVQPTTVSKWNTLIQLSLMGLTTVSPILSHDLSGTLAAMQWLCASTTLYSGFEYVVENKGVKYL